MDNQRNSDADTAANRTSHMYSYQHAPPTVYQFDDENDAEYKNNGSNQTPKNTVVQLLKQSYYGDTTILPNNGLTNQYEYALFGLALHELLERLQLSIVFNAVCIVVLLFLTWYVQLFQPVHLLLSIILFVLMIVLLIVEIKGMLLPSSSSSSSTTTSNNATTNRIAGTAAAAIIEQYERSINNGNNTTSANQKNIFRQIEYIGCVLLYHPYGRIIYLLCCAILCYSITGMVLLLLGIWLLCNTFILFYCWITYPEFRRTFQTTTATNTPTATTNSSATSTSSNINGSSRDDLSQQPRSWSYYSSVFTSSTSSSGGGSSEHVSLIQ